ncbi:protein-glutamine gamma-glutamyltransferase [Domibacillus sp. PGB-M46]|uniref:protein-glutamine gamma-glutamyltransferase n=1 Tax=Domibacillus sp. PGB-M46 TaxID=2910255 RepID=UPI001F55D17B|nr:protein-glutamine gamma-glutamyltransferase [Domibacillus sp. PGB-M46]MCI2256567.1 protein-glutamine gamma-glutamyltransferase [Domibacillus sp. PGB-M46]
MIRLSGMPFQQSTMWPSGSIESIILRRMNNDTAVYSYSFIGELSFELQLRKNIIISARAMNKSGVRFAVFADSRCNPQYWKLTSTGGFLLKHGVKSSDAIEDIYINSSQYAFECATAMVIIYYHALLNTIGESLFNRLFQTIYLYSWHADPDLGIKPLYKSRFLPGDIVYFRNPDFNPQTPQWRGENAVVLEDDMYFGHGLGIKTAERMIHALNQRRIPGADQSAYLTNVVVRPSFKHLATLSALQPVYSIYKYQPVIQHNQSSVSFDQYVTYL